MTSPVVAVLPYAVGALAASVPVVAMAAVLATVASRAVLVRFTAGWVVGLTVTSAVGMLVFDGAAAATGSTAWVSWLRVVLAVVLVLLAVRRLVARARSGPPSGEPSWLESLRGTSPGRAFALAALLGSVNPKNAAIVLSAVSAVLASTTVLAEQVLPVLLFVLVASLGVLAPLLALAVLGARAARALEAFVAWFVRSSDLVMVVVLLGLAVMVGSAGVSGLR